MIPQLFTTTNDVPSEFKDPFLKDCVEEVHIHIYKGKNHWAIVKTINGDTSGEQKFRATEINDLFFRIENYLNQLE